MFSTTLVHQINIFSTYFQANRWFWSFENSGAFIYGLWVCLRIRNPRNPEMIHFRKPLDFWASNFGMSSRPQLTRNEKKKPSARRSLQQVVWVQMFFSCTTCRATRYVGMLTHTGQRCSNKIYPIVALPFWATLQVRWILYFVGDLYGCFQK